MAGFLLDTHIWLWMSITPRRLSRMVKRRLENPSAVLWVSPVSLFEAEAAHRRGRLEDIGNFSDWVNDSFERFQLRSADMTRQVAMEAQSYRLPHGDPADQMIVATARAYGLVLVTDDARIIESQAVATLPNG
ncbi:MAG: hypothetical protein B7Z41_05580 [Rhizobiales bacterium 12-66-7]|nr:MAG: hypothetical protein B7Z41_05580 [Rhizobiales bacterium 12-66-7]